MKRIRWPVLAAVGVLVAGSGTAYAVTSDGSTGSYRTVRATTGDVEQVLSTSGTVDAAHRADLGFGTSGTVADVKVALGDTVKAGQVIATLDTDDLRAAVTRAKAGVARAEAQLEADENAQEQTVADAATSAQGSTPQDGDTSWGAPTDSGPDNGSGTAAALAALEAQQAAVVEAQSTATAAITAAKEALAAQTAACADAYQDDPAPAGDAESRSEDPAVDPDSSDANAACSEALAEVQARQDAVSEAQDALAGALSTLATTLSKALATLDDSGTPPADGSTTPSGSTDTPATDTTDGAADAAADLGSDATSGTSSAAQLAADQAAIEQAEAELVDARQQLRQAVLRSTRSGKVVSLDVARGDQVSAGDVAATVVGGTAVTVEATITESKIGQVEVGQRVRVTTPGESGNAEGTVTAIGLVADSSSGTASYPVTVTVEDPAIALPAGSQAMLAIVVATAEDVVTVPTSAITRRGDGSVVQTWDGETLSSRTVTIGTVGAREVEVTEGLSAGDEVVLADLDQPITGAADSINDRGGFGEAPAFRIERAGPGGGPPVTFRSGG